jgi:ABC-type antimicrobial peptide transport system permease subunit
LSYVIPAIVAGMIVSIPFLAITANMLRSSMGVEISITPTPNAVGLALGLGFLIPMFSSIVPIKEALKQQLSFALDLNRSKS